MNQVRRVALCAIAIGLLIVRRRLRTDNNGDRSWTSAGSTGTASRLRHHHGKPSGQRSLPHVHHRTRWQLRRIQPSAHCRGSHRLGDGFQESHRSGLVLEVGRTTTLEIELTVGRVQETVDVGVVAPPVDATRSVVDAVIGSNAIEALPLNGRNFLELALLVPGNAPAPNFDPTKSEQRPDFVRGSARPRRQHHDRRRGQQRRRRRRSAAERHAGVGAGVPDRDESILRGIWTLGRLRHQRRNKVRHRSSSRIGIILRPRQRLAGRCRRPSIDRAEDELPFDREQLAGSAGGRLRARLFWFGAAEYRNQDGAVLVGTRDVPTRTIRRTFAPAPLDDVLGSGRVDWRPSDDNALMVRYAGEQATDTGASTLDRAIGSASQRQRSQNRYNSMVGTWTRVVGPTLVNAATVSFSGFDNAIAPVASGPQLTFPSIQDGSSFRVPQGTTQNRFQVADTVSLVRGSHSLRAGGEWQRVSALFDLGVFRDGRIEFVEDFATFDHNGDGRVDDNTN